MNVQLEGTHAVTKSSMKCIIQAPNYSLQSSVKCCVYQQHGIWCTPNLLCFNGHFNAV